MSKLKNNKKRGALAAASVLLCATLLLAALTFLPVHGEERIYDAVIRLHVLANSDSEQDQTLKLTVRDAVLAVVSAATAGCEDREQARQVLSGMLPELTAVAEQTLRDQGCEQAVRVTLGEEKYPTRNYESFCFPAGEYLSLRVMIGKAQGQNFWCVLFPPLCMSAATVSSEEAEEEFIAVGLTKDQYGIITQTQKSKYKLRFRLLELLFGSK